MARREEDFEEEDDFPRRKKKARGFWSTQKILFVLVFVAGLIIGFFATNQFIDPFLGNGPQSKAADLGQINQELDSLNDKYYSCLQTFQIDPATCTK